MKRFRQFIVGLIAPCRCKPTYTTGAFFEWCSLDASKCQRWGHEDEERIVGPSSRRSGRVEVSQTHQEPKR